MHEMIPLEFLPAGHSAAVGQLVGGQNDVHRLEELGLRGGTQIEMVQPGSPCIVPAGRSEALLSGRRFAAHLGPPGGAGVSVLAELAVGGSGRILAVEGTDDVSLRLMEMGLTPGVEVAVVGVAPWGGPLELEVRGYHLSLRRSEAARVAITP